MQTFRWYPLHLIKFDNIPNVKPSDFTETNEYKNDVHICYTNKNELKLTLLKWKNCMKRKIIIG